MTTAKARASATARKLEAAPTPEPDEQVVTVEHDGQTYRIDPDALDLEALERLEEAPMTTLREWFGRTQWQTFKDAHRDAKGRVPVESLNPLIAAVMDAVGKLPQSG